MIQKLAGWLFKTHGWKIVGKPLPPEAFRCMLVFAPHTSNWDFYYGVLGMTAWGLPVKYVIKDFWTRFPFGLIVKPLGGVGISREISKSKKGLISRLASEFDKQEQITFVITPEGSRQKRNKWRTGFYHIAREANVPIVTMRADFDSREVSFGPVLQPHQTVDEVMKAVTAFYLDSVALYPESFAVDHRYAPQLHNEKGD